jgi:LuxR family maltose regulon positive regulatory protein
VPLPLGDRLHLPDSKLRLPGLRAGVLRRPRLTERLMASDARVVLIAAPAGFGKTTLLTQWADQDGRRFAYLALDASDNDPLALWSGVVLSIRRLEPGFGASVEPMLQSLGGTVVDALVRRLSVELEALDEPVVLVLDDYHVIRDPTCHASIEALIAQNLATVQVVLSTRFDRPVRLGRLRASGELLEIRGHDLAFTAEETEALLSQEADLVLAPDDVAILEQRTEGWPAGLQLATLGLRAAADASAFVRSFGGSHRHVVDYLSEAVLDSLDQEVRDFLVDTSILARLTGSLCDAVTGREDSATLLDELERGNVFVISLDDQRRWYRYHHLFAELLHDRLRATSPDRQAALHRAAYQWFTGAGEVDLAIEHAVAAGDFEAAKDLVVDNVTERLAAGRLATVLAWLDRFPEGRVSSTASLSIARAWACGLLGRRDAASQAIEDALTADASEDRMPDGARNAAHSAALLRSALPFGDVGRLEEAAASLPAFSAEFKPQFQAAVAIGTGLAAFLSGRHDEAAPQLERAVALATETRTWVSVMDGFGLGAHVALSQGHAEEAVDLALQANEQARAHGLVDLPHAGYYGVALGAAMARCGSLEAGDEKLARGIEQFGEWDLLLAAHARLLRVPVRRQMGDTTGSRRLLDEAKSMLARCKDPGYIGQLVPTLERSLATSHRRVEHGTELTDRELDVLRLLDAGLSRREIAQELFVSFNTVHTHMKSIYARLDATSRAEALERARDLDLL